MTLTPELFAKHNSLLHVYPFIICYFLNVQFYKQANDYFHRFDNHRLHRDCQSSRFKRRGESFFAQILSFGDGDKAESFFLYFFDFACVSDKPMDKTLVVVFH